MFNIFSTSTSGASEQEEGEQVQYDGWSPPEDRTSNAAEGGASQNDEALAAADDGHTGETIDKELMMKNFIDSMMAGIVLIKHGKQGDPHRRRIFCDENVETISWKKENGSQAKNKDAYPITGIKEIRWACEPDPDGEMSGEALAGTKVLRDSCRWEDAPLSFSIIWEERTLDLQCHTRLECKYLIHCFRQLIEDKKRRHPDIRRRSISENSAGVIEPNAGVSALAKAAKAALED